MSELKQGSYTRTEGRQAGGTFPRFFTDSVLDHLATAQAGTDVFKDEERVEIIMPGISQLTKPVEKVRKEHIDRWPDEYKAFKAGQEFALNGTPLEQWPILKRAQVLTLKAADFRTVEDIAGMSDIAVQRVGMGGARLRDLARSYLDEAVAQAVLARTTAENERNQVVLAEQNEKIANLSSLCERLGAQIVAMQNAPSAIATHIPGMHDPMEAARQAMMPQEPVAASGFADLPAPRTKRQKAEAAS